MRKRGTIHLCLLSCFALFHFFEGVCGQPAVAALDISMSLDIPDSTSTMTGAQLLVVSDFLLRQVLASCGGVECGVVSGDVVISNVTVGVPSATNITTHTFGMKVRVQMPNNARTLSVQTSKTLEMPVFGADISQQLGFNASDYGILYRRDGNRPYICGDNQVQPGEICDDGNTDAGDGCSAVCTLETGFMCHSAIRSGVDPETPGSMVEWVTNATANTKRLVILATPETCTKDHICVQSSPRWTPSNWTNEYGAIDLTTLPPDAFYCDRFCVETFTPPKYYEFDGTCMPTPVNECQKGLSTCDPNALCTEPSGGVGFECQCDQKYFVKEAMGVSCGTSGIEVKFTIGGMRVSQVPANENEDRDNILAARLMFIDELIRTGYVNALSSPALLLEGVETYPIDRISENVQDPESSIFGRSWWRIILRAPESHLDMAKMQQGLIFDDVSVWQGIFNDSSKYQVNTKGECTNDRARSCNPTAPISSCLNGAVCLLKADFSYGILSAGGVSAPLQIGSSGLEIKSVDYDIMDSAFKIRMRFDNVVPGVMDTVFISHMGTDAIFRPTFNSDEFPCYPLGTGQFQNQRDNSGVFCHFRTESYKR